MATDDQDGTVTVAAWAGLHPKQHRHPGHGSGGPRPIVRGTILRVRVQRVPTRTRPPTVLWLWWAGPGQPDLERAWRAYTRRFDLEHTIWFCTPTLGVDHPTASHACPGRPVDLAGAGRLHPAAPGRQLAADQRLAWERPRPPGQLSPYRVRRGVSRLLCVVGSPAAAPKPCGRSPGRPKDRRSSPALRHPAVKKPTKNPRKKRPTTKAA